MRNYTHQYICALVLLTAAVTISPSPIRAQGDIFGVVQNADLTNPAADELSWFGFLDDTDEEIRIESNVGSGYDGLHWFDNFQNYTTETAGNPYDHYFVNAAKSQGFHLARTIPSNSFQNEDVTLATVTVATTPASVTGTVLSPSEIQLRWNGLSGLTYHVYRRVTSNNSVFRRLDDPTGSLANRGVADSVFIDATSDGVSDYTYLVIAEDDFGNYSTHSALLAVGAGGPSCICDCPADFDCNGARDSVDLSSLIDAVFFSGTDPLDSACPVKRGDFSCDGFTDSVDLSQMIDHVFFSGPPPCNPCSN